MAEGLRRLMAGWQTFHATYFDGSSDLYRRLAEGQAPKVLVVACSDSRVDPAILTGSAPGELFVVRNVAAIVPPYVADGASKDTGAAIEFAVRGLAVEHILVLGHARCGGVRALMGGGSGGGDFEFLQAWVSQAAPARAAVAAALSDAPEPVFLRALEQATLLVSLGNLLGFPWIREAVHGGRLTLHGWYFDLVAGQLLGYDARSGRFLPVADSLSGHGAADHDCVAAEGYDLEAWLRAGREALPTAA